MIERETRVLATGIEHPEGPDILPGGDIVFVETWTGKVKALAAGREVYDYATTHGGPNACSVGADGSIYVTQNGGVSHTWRADRPSPPGIQRVSPTGSGASKRLLPPWTA